MKQIKRKHLIPLREIFFSCMAALLSLSTLAQNRQMQMEEFAKPVETKGWIDFREGNTLNPQTLFVEKKEMFGLTAFDDMQQYKMQADELGFTHFRFQQYHKGLKIIGAETILHHNGSYLKSMNGYIAENLAMDVLPVIQNESGLEIAKNVCKAEKFVWEHPEIAEVLSKNSNGQKDFGKPTGELVICRKNWDGDFTAENLALAYVYKLIALPMHFSMDVYVDAKTGEVINKLPLVANCNSNTGNTTWYGSKNFNAGYYGWPNNAWLLESHCPSEATMRSMRGDPLVPYSYGDADAIWTDTDGTGGYNQKAGVTTYWNLHKAYDYYKIYHNRSSFDNANTQLDAFSEVAGGLFIASANNANYSSIYHTMHFGSGSTASPSDDWNTLDIVGHELTHGMHQWSVGFNYSGEPGALDESFADIFGECIETHAKGLSAPDWLVGADRGESIRSLSDPNALLPATGGGFWGQDPDTYLGNFWFTVPGCTYDPINGSPTDFCGVHTNSGVQNFWFYLLVTGGSGTNDNAQAYSVTGISMNAAKSITYRNMDSYLTTSSGYFDAREGSIRAAEDLFGSCSNEVLQTARAWYAVGVATTCPDWNYSVPCGNVPNGLWHRGINSLITNTSCTTTIISGNNSLFSSGAAGGVTLKVGFTAQQGCAFTALIDNCNEAAYNLRTATSENFSEEKSIAPTAVLKINNVFPNPAKDYVVLTVQSPENILDEQLTVADLTGRVSTIKISGRNDEGHQRKIKLDVAALKEGIYLLQIKNRRGSATAKIVVSR
jgi:bacillolysin